VPSDPSLASGRRRPPGAARHAEEVGTLAVNSLTFSAASFAFDFDANDSPEDATV
jgi:hypothetical protein